MCVIRLSIDDDCCEIRSVVAHIPSVFMQGTRAVLGGREGAILSLLNGTPTTLVSYVSPSWKSVNRCIAPFTFVFTTITKISRGYSRSVT